MPAKRRKPAPRRGRKKQKTTSSADFTNSTAHEATTPPTSGGHTSPSPPSKSLNDLSNELLTSIVEFVQDPEVLDDQPWDSSALEALCLTSKSFNLTATPILYRTVDLRFRRIASVRPLLRTLSIKPLLALKVEKLSMQTTPGYHFMDLDRKRKLEHSEIAKILANIGNLPPQLLRRLQLGGWNAELAILLLLIRNLRYLNICISARTSLMRVPDELPLLLLVEQTTTIRQSTSFLHGVLVQLKEVRAYPHYQMVAETRHEPWRFERTVDMEMSACSALVQPSVRHLSMDRTRHIWHFIHAEKWCAPSLTSLTLTTSMILEVTLYGLLKECHHLEHICVRWCDYRSLREEEAELSHDIFAFPTETVGPDQGLEPHFTSLQSLVLDMTALICYSSLVRPSQSSYKANITSLKNFSSLETLELEDRHIVEGHISPSDQVQLAKYQSGLSSLNNDFFPPSLKSFTLFSRAKHWDAYNILALLVDFLPSGLEYVCVKFRMEMPRSSAKLERYIQQIEQRSELSDPPKIQMQLQPPQQLPGHSILQVEYSGPNLSAKLNTFKTEWRRRALQIHQKRNCNDDLLW